MTAVRAQDYVLTPISELTPHPDNPRVGELGRIEESIAAHGFYGAIVVQRSTGYVLAGNHRMAAAKRQGLTELPVIWVDVDDHQARRILLVDNRTSDLGTYDDDLLAKILSELADSEDELLGTGYTTDELADLLDGETDDDRAPSTGELIGVADVSWGEPTHQPEHGQVWTVGPHTLVVARLHDEHKLWKRHLSTKHLFAPYPEPYLTATDKAAEAPLLMVQPNTFLAGHLLDKHTSMFPTDTVELQS